jgi:hypothetical protein
LSGLGVIFREFLSNSLDNNIRDVLNQDWAALRGYLRIEKGEPKWFYDRDDTDENYIVSRLKRVYLITDARGTVLEGSEAYAELGEDTPDEVRATLRSHDPTWRIKRSKEGVPYLIRSGMVLSNDKHRDLYFVAIGRSLADNQSFLVRFTRIYVGLMPIMIFGGCLLGWLIAGRALTPVSEVAGAAQRISGSNLSLRIPTRGAGDELDYLNAWRTRSIRSGNSPPMFRMSCARR